MIAAGCTPWFHSEELGVMGLTEVLRHLPRLLRLRAALQQQILEWRPDVFIGVDFKEFNLGLARRLKKQGLRTVQYVSPQVWAWRQGRARTIGEAVDLILCLFPFEPDFLSRVRRACRPSSDIRWPTRYRWTSIAPPRAPGSASRRPRACSRSCPAAGAPKWSGWPSPSRARRSCWPRVIPGWCASRRW